MKGEGGGGGGWWVQLGWVEGWGEKAYNCNLITIKFRKNNCQVVFCRQLYQSALKIIDAKIKNLTDK